MAANLVMVTEAEAAVVRAVLGRLGEGGILIFPEQAKKFTEDTGLELGEDDDCDCIPYDFGGEADVWVDILDTHTDYQGQAIKAHLGVIDDACDKCKVEAVRAMSVEKEGFLYKCAKCGHEYVAVPEETSITEDE